jgi:hypothetical protein
MFAAAALGLALALGVGLGGLAAKGRISWWLLALAMLSFIGGAVVG